MKNIYQIDMLKGFAIISVLMIHARDSNFLHRTYSFFHIWQAVPIFLIIMGLNWGFSFNRKGFTTLREYYTIDYFKKCFRRFFLPFTGLFIVSLVIGLLKSKLTISWLNLVGYLPHPGPGNYFITVIFQFVILFPFVYWCYTKTPVLTILMCFLTDLTFQLASPYIPLFESFRYLYNASIFRFLSSIAIGLWLSTDLGFSKRNLWLVFSSVISIVYLMLYTINPSDLPFFIDDSKFQHIFSYPYAALLVMLGIKCLKRSELLIQLGKASYYIFLMQIVFFSI